MEDLTKAVETAKRTSTKVKIDRKLGGQSTLTLFIKNSDGHDYRTAFFDDQSTLYIKIDEITAMMGKVTAQSVNQGKPFKP